MLLDASPIRLGQSPGTNNPAVLAYDATGLRSTMTATWTELDKAVIKNALPDHLPGSFLNNLIFPSEVHRIVFNRQYISKLNELVSFALGPEWENHIDEIEAECVRKGVPFVMGRKYKFEVSENYNTLRW